MTNYTPEERKLIDEIRGRLPEDTQNAARKANREYACYLEQTIRDFPDAFARNKGTGNPFYESQDLPQTERDKLKQLNQQSNRSFMSLTNTARDIARQMGVEQQVVKDNPYFHLYDSAALDAVRPELGPPQCNLTSDAAPLKITVASATPPRRAPSMGM